MKSLSCVLVAGDLWRGSTTLVGAIQMLLSGQLFSNEESKVGYEAREHCRPALYSSVERLSFKLGSQATDFR